MSLLQQGLVLTEATALGTILLVEDEQAIRAVACRILRRRGYTVLEAVDGGHALSVAEAHTGTIELLLTDLVLPGIGGAEVASRIGDARPTMQVIYMSGYGEEDLGTHGVHGPAFFLGKPFRPDELIDKVRNALA